MDADDYFAAISEAWPLYFPTQEMVNEKQDPWVQLTATLMHWFGQCMETMLKNVREPTLARYGCVWSSPLSSPLFASTLQVDWLQDEIIQIHYCEFMRTCPVRSIDISLK